MEEKKLIKLATIFYITSIIGYIYELIITYIYENKLYSHGFLFGPWLPIYGVGGVIIYFLYKYKNNPFKIFILSFFLTGILEYLSGLILLKVFKMRLWDYTGCFLNINGFVCFLSAFCFGVGSLVLTYLIFPLIDKLLNKVNRRNIKICLSLISSLFLLDIFLTSIM